MVILVVYGLDCRIFSNNIRASVKKTQEREGKRERVINPLKQISNSVWRRLQIECCHANAIISIKHFKLNYEEDNCFKTNKVDTEEF